MHATCYMPHSPGQGAVEVGGTHTNCHAQCGKQTHTHTPELKMSVT